MPNLTFAISRKYRIIIPLVSAGDSFSLLTKFSSKTFSWGLNTSGPLGNNSTLLRTAPVSVCGTVKTFCAIDAGSNYSIAINKDGRLWSWGAGNVGQLGDNSTTSRSTPISVCGAVKTFCRVSAGNNHTLAIDKNGRAWGWGSGLNGRIGNNLVSSRLTPVSVLGAVKTFCRISAGNGYSVAIDKNGRAWSWGLNTSGQLGQNSVTSRLTPASICGAVKTFCEISAGGTHSLAIDKNGTVWGWGLGTSGQLGDNSLTTKSTPVSVCGAVKTFCKISGGATHSLAIDKNGRLWAWGAGGSGQLGVGTFSNSCTPVSVVGVIKTFCQISAGNLFSLAVDKNGKTWSWGLNTSGQLGDYAPFTPISVCGAVKTFCQISAGNSNGVTIDKNGRVWSWGSNTNGGLGDNSTTNKSTPVSVCGAVRTFCAISCSDNNSVAIDKNGRAWAWGTNINGELGDNSTTSKSTPISVCGAVKTFCKISTGGGGGSGGTGCLAIDKNGRAWGWGSGASGRKGDGQQAQTLTPVSVCGAVKTFCEISTAKSGSSTLSIDKNGRLWSWGNNLFGQLGDITTIDKCTPVSVCGAVKTFCRISAGRSCFAIDKNGRLWAWGLNTSGQLGDNSIINKCTPVSVCGAVKTFCHISSGNDHSLAIDKNGTVWAWGVNTYGQLGDESLTSKSTPVSVRGALKTFCWISASNAFSLAIDKNGRSWAWGINTSGQLGRDTIVSTPIMIPNI